MTLLVVVAVVVALLGGGGAAAVTTIKRRQRADNEVVPGVPTTAPVAWAGAHTVEAKLHRRLRDAVRALRANPALAADGFGDARSSLERHALDVDARLVAAAAVDESRRGAAVARVAEAVAALEAAVARLAVGSGGSIAIDGAVDRALAEAEERIAALAAAHAELDAAEARGATGAGGTAAS